jgi:hypothetical protein
VHLLSTIALIPHAERTRESDENMYSYLGSRHHPNHGRAGCWVYQSTGLGLTLYDLHLRLDDICNP